MELPQSFELALGDFGKKMGRELAMLNGQCNFTVDGTVEVEIDYLDDTHVVILWAVIGYAPEDGYAAARAKYLLERNAIAADNGGFSFSFDSETRRFIAHDVRPAELFDSADRIAAWVSALVAQVQRIREDFTQGFPCPDFLPDDEEESLNEEEEA